MNGIYDVPAGPLDGGQPHPEAERLFRAAVTIRLFSLGMAGALVLVALVLHFAIGLPEAHAGSSDMVVLPLAFVAVLSALAAVFVVPRIVPVGSPDSASGSASTSDAQTTPSIASRLVTRSSMSGAWSTTPAFLGFVVSIMGASLGVFLAFVAVAAVSSVLTFPRWSEWDEAGALATVRIPTTR